MPIYSRFTDQVGAINPYKQALCTYQNVGLLSALRTVQKAQVRSVMTKVTITDVRTTPQNNLSKQPLKATVKILFKRLFFYDSHVKVQHLKQ
jgi:hypothetical protein